MTRSDWHINKYFLFNESLCKDIGYQTTVIWKETSQRTLLLCLGCLGSHYERFFDLQIFFPEETNKKNQMQLEIVESITTLDKLHKQQGGKKIYKKLLAEHTLLENLDISNFFFLNVFWSNISGIKSKSLRLFSWRMKNICESRLLHLIKRQERYITFKVALL